MIYDIVNCVHPAHTDHGHIPPREVRSQAVIDSRLTSRLVLTLASPLRMLQMSLVCP